MRLFRERLLPCFKVLFSVGSAFSFQLFPGSFTAADEIAARKYFTRHLRSCGCCIAAFNVCVKHSISFHNYNDL